MKAVWVGAVAMLAASAALALAQQTPSTAWISAGTTGVLPAQAEYPTPTGRVGLLLSGGPVDMKGHPFFTPLGQERTRLRDLPSAGIRHEFFCRGRA